MQSSNNRLVVKRKYLIVLGILNALGITVPIVLREVIARIQEKMNPVLSGPPYSVSVEAARLHASLTIADLHSDALLWGSDLTRKHRTGHVDIPRLLEGNVALQVFSVVTKVPKMAAAGGFISNSDEISRLAKVGLWPLSTWSSLTKRALYQASRLRRFEQRSKGTLRIVTSRRELEDFLTQRKTNPAMVAGVLSLEGAHALDGKLENVNLLYEAGFRLIGLSHFFNNELGGASLDAVDKGLTDFGRDVVKRLEQKGIILDLAHASTQSVEDILELTRGPIVVSHTGLENICPNQRNLSDEQIGRIIARGGLIGIGYGPFFNCDLSVKAIVNSIRHVTHNFGIEHVALGSDFDGTILAPFDTSGLPLLTQALLDEGFTPQEIHRIMGGNVLDFLLQALP